MLLVVYSIRLIITDLFAKKYCFKKMTYFTFQYNINYFFFLPIITLINTTFTTHNSIYSTNTHQRHSKPFFSLFHLYIFFLLNMCEMSKRLGYNGTEGVINSKYREKKNSFLVKESYVISFRFKCVIGPCTFIRFWHWSLHFFLFGIDPCTL